jgi:hypothetical protein
MKDGRPFGIGGLWENWKDPKSGDSVRTFAVITTDANSLVAEIHDRMPLILVPDDYDPIPSSARRTLMPQSSHRQLWYASRHDTEAEPKV